VRPVQYAKTVPLVLCGHDAGIRLGASKYKRVKWLAEIALAPLSGEGVEVVGNMVLAADDDARWSNCCH
jgi:hypothetical protein